MVHSWRRPMPRAASTWVNDKRRFAKIASLTRLMFTAVTAVGGRPDRGRSSADCLPFLNAVAQSYTVLLPVAWSPQTPCKRRWMSAVEAPSFHRNDADQRCLCVSDSISSVVVTDCWRLAHSRDLSFSQIPFQTNFVYMLGSGNIQAVKCTSLVHLSPVVCLQINELQRLSKRPSYYILYIFIIIYSI